MFASVRPGCVPCGGGGGGGEGVLALYPLLVLSPCQ